MNATDAGDNLAELKAILADYRKGRDVTEALEQLVIVMEGQNESL